LFRRVPKGVRSVLVTVPRSSSWLVEAYERLRPDVVQLHGEGLEGYSALKRLMPSTPLVAAVQVGRGGALEEALRLAELFDGVLADSYRAGSYGGTGATHDWSLSRKLRDAVYPQPLMLAGGLNPRNVKEAVRRVAPYAVDASSGVEVAPGVKDRRLVEAFVKAAREVVLEDDDYGGLGW
jgi:phosphoribosylanthranilate isomerase